MKKKFNLAILVAAFSFLFFAAHAQNEGAVRMLEAEVDNYTYVEQPKSSEEVVSHQAPAKEVSEKKLAVKKVNDLKAKAKVIKADRIKKNLKAEQTTASKNVKLAIILIVMGAILTIFPILWIIGLILVLVGLVILLLEII